MMSKIGRLAGLDVGEKRIGVAVSDGIGLTAQGVGVLLRRSRRADTAALLAMLQPYEVTGFVAGLPLRMDGSEGEQADRVRHFCEHLAADTGLPVHYQDERLTSAQGERLLIAGGVRRNERRERLDQVAAALILQAYLDSRPATVPTPEGADPEDR